MANENKEIGDIVKKCKILLLDIEGTTTSISFVKDKLFPYAEENVKQFLESQWENDDVKKAVDALRKLAIEDLEAKVDGVVTIPGEDASKEEQIEGLVKSVKWQMSSDRKVAALKQIQGLIWKQGYDNGDIKGHVYDDVSPALEQWHTTDGQKVYIYSSGSVQAQKLLFAQSSAGDLLRFIDGHFDTAVGPKQEAASYTNIAEKLDCKADEILFLTDIVKEAEAARVAGMNAALVSREGNAPLPSDATEAFRVLHSLAELTVTNKRKPEPQEELPAKIPKTVAEEDVKTASPKAEVSADATPSDAEAKPEKMETDDVPATEEPKEKEIPAEKADPAEKVVKAEKVVETIIEEITDSNEAKNIPVVEDKAIVEEKIEEKETKTEEKKTEKMEVESTEPDTAEAKPAETTNGVEKTPVITEIEDISDKQVTDDAEVIEDIEPVVEEPAAGEDMEVLQNVGEVLEKECDEILSKVQDVTNLDNIPLKPLLKPIAEETMESENTDTNDIVDGILDSEMEMEMKQCSDDCGDIDLATVAEITDDVKTKVTEDNSTKVSDSTTEKSDDNTETKTETVEANVATEQIVEEISTKETKADEPKVEEGPKPDDSKESPVEVSSAPEKTPESKESDSATEAKVTPEEVKPTTEEAKPEETKTDEVPSAPENNKPDEVKPTDEVKTTEETKPSEEIKPSEEVKATEESKPKEEEVKEPKLNGKATNGNSETVTNGDASKDEELNSRLSVENGKEVVNGTNGDSMETEAGQGDSKVEEIKVKTVSTDEPRTDPIEQPTEA